MNRWHWVLTIMTAIILSICSTAILSYISMAVMIGPWIHSTVVLTATIIFRLCAADLIGVARMHALSYVTVAASIGGILATGCGFAFPTLYFLHKPLFDAWLSNPGYFIALMASVTFIAGMLALLVADFFETELLVDQQLPFPIGELSYKLIAAQNNGRQSGELAGGFIITSVYSIWQIFSATLPRFVSIVPQITYTYFTLPALRVPLFEGPMLWAIGYITGHVIAVPLGFGIVSKLIIIDPIQRMYFSQISSLEFSFAFCSGMLLYGAVMSLILMPKTFRSAISNLSNGVRNRTDQTKKVPRISFVTGLVLVLFVLGASALFRYFNFSWTYQLYVIGFTIVCAYQLLVIGGKIGMAPVARFATFVMIPGILLFGFDPVQITIVSVFVEVCGGVAVDLLFGRALGRHAQADRSTVKAFQWLGLAVSALTVGLFFYLLITRIGLGSDQLLAQRAQNRALMVSFGSFDFHALVVGALFGAFLKDFKINPIMVLGGILMPLDWSLLLVVSGLSTYLFDDKERWYPFFSGVFASSSLLMVLKSFMH